MKPFHLQIELAANTANFTVQWFGKSAVHAEGSRELTPLPGARTLLVSPQDGAVFLSQWKHRQNRVGYVPPVTIVPGRPLGSGRFPSRSKIIS